MKSRPFFAIALVATALPFAAHAAPDAKFLSDAMKGDNSEVMLGRLAAQNASSSDAREFGQTLARDHATARSEVDRLARREHVAMTAATKPEARAERERLMRLQGQRFDQEFARYMVNDHRKDIAKFEAQARKGGATGRLAKEQLPTLRKHLEMAERLAGRR